MRRRDFIMVVGGAVGWPLATRAQQRDKLPTIAFLGADDFSWRPRTSAFGQRLRELGWVEGHSVKIQYYWAQGRQERVVELAAEIPPMVDVIVTYGQAATALKKAITVTPIVFAIANDPIGSGLVASLSRPGGNITGLSLEVTEIAGKRFQLLHDVLPNLRQLAVLFDVGYSASDLQMREVQTAAHTLGVEVQPIKIRQAEDIAPAFEVLKSLKVDALYVVENSLIQANGRQIAAFSLRARLPTVFGARDQVEAGGLMCYGPKYTDLFRRAAEIVDKILRGAKPGDIPVEEPTTFELVINLTTAKALGLTVPPTLLATADEVIE
jgi:putative tryptophan/tyrosine transport system substrate-binding protein